MTIHLMNVKCDGRLRDLHGESPPLDCDDSVRQCGHFISVTLSWPVQLWLREKVTPHWHSHNTIQKNLKAKQLRCSGQDMSGEVDVNGIHGSKNLKNAHLKLLISFQKFHKVSIGVMRFLLQADCKVQNKQVFAKLQLNQFELNASSL